MGAAELQRRVVEQVNPALENYRAWESQHNAAMEEIEEIDALLTMAHRLTSNGNGLWKTRYLWIFILFSSLQLIPLMLYLLR